MSQGRNGVALTGALLLVAALLAPGAANADAPGTMVLDIIVSAGPAEIRPGPLTVPNPEVPNPFYDALLRAEPFTQAAPAQIEDAPDGLYFEAADNAPIRVIGWAPGIGQRTWTPLEYAGQAIGAQTGLPVQLNGCACAVPPAYGTAGVLTSVLSLSPAGSGAGGVKPSLPLLTEEPVGAALAEEFDIAAPEPYTGARAGPATSMLAPEGILALPAKNDSSTALAAVIAAGAALLLLKLVVLPLYHRFKRKTALDNPTRQRIYELLRAAPGASAADLSEGSHLHVTTVKYHLDVLRRVGMVGEQSVDGCRRFFSYENGDRVEFLTRALLDEPAAKAIFAQIQQHPGLPFIEVARALGMRKEHVHYHVKKLAKHGLLVDRWEAGRRLLFVAPPGHVHIAAHGPAAPPPGPAPLHLAAPAPPMHPEVRA